MNPARIVFPAFWFGKSDLETAKTLAKRGVGGFCVYGGTAQETARFIEVIREASIYDHVLICADIEEDLSEIITDAPKLPTNIQVSSNLNGEDAYRKGLITARLARSLSIDWLLCPVVDIGYQSPTFGDVPLNIARSCGDYTAGAANGGMLNCIKYFPGINGILKTLVQMEEAEFVPYKHMFRRTDAVMLSDMVFSNLDPANRAMMSEKIIKALLKKRLNYKGCVLSAPLFKSHIKQEANAALKMLHAGVELILAPQDPVSVIEAVEKDFQRGSLAETIIRGISNIELFTSKVTNTNVPLFSWSEALQQAVQFTQS